MDYKIYTGMKVKFQLYIRTLFRSLWLTARLSSVKTFFPFSFELGFAGQPFLITCLKVFFWCVFSFDFFKRLVSEIILSSSQLSNIEELYL